jgi:hypothetical protein
MRIGSYSSHGPTFWIKGLGSLSQNSSFGSAAQTTVHPCCLLRERKQASFDRLGVKLSTLQVSEIGALVLRTHFVFSLPRNLKLLFSGIYFFFPDWIQQVRRFFAVVNHSRVIVLVRNRAGCFCIHRFGIMPGYRIVRKRIMIAYRAGDEKILAPVSGFISFVVFLP